MELNVVVPSIVSLIVGLTGGMVGAYIGMKVGLVRLETWRDIVDGDIKALSRDMRLHQEDLLVHDMEIGDVMRKCDMDRIVRQRVR
jgi:hypothetical protein